MDASLRLTRWLRCTYGIALRNVIGHNESLSSPYHRERVPAFRHQTHSDWNSVDMRVYRRRLARLSCPTPARARPAEPRWRQLAAGAAFADARDLAAGGGFSRTWY